MNKDALRKLPGVDFLLDQENGKKLVEDYGRERVVQQFREELDKVRKSFLSGGNLISSEDIIIKCSQKLSIRFRKSLKPVINGSGIILHTNLGRAPLGKKVISDLSEIVSGYSNLEFDLEKGRRGQRNEHVRNILKELTGAEDAIVVNNNAAAVLLVFQTLAKGSEVIVSRGELIEIGGSFRIPDIMSASGAIMHEVGCTNRTRIADYENAMSKDTAMIFKAHKSNYYIGGFSEEASLEDMVKLAHEKDMIMYYDIGSGLLRKPDNLPLEDEPDVRNAILSGVDIVSFSGDKLLGGPQAGIIAGKAEYIQKLAKAPMMRALRVGKLTLSALLSVMNAYLKDTDMVESMPIFSFMNRKMEDKYLIAQKLQNLLNEKGIDSKIIDSKGRCGGGTLPHLDIPSYAVKIELKDKDERAEDIFSKLLTCEQPVLGILREGELVFDVLSLFEEDLAVVAELVANQI